MLRSKVVKMQCSISPDVRTWIEAKAALNLQPMTSVIVTALRAQMDAEQRQERASLEAAG
jgi:hypothetical protein